MQAGEPFQRLIGTASLETAYSGNTEDAPEDAVALLPRENARAFVSVKRIVNDACPVVDSVVIFPARQEPLENFRDA